MTTNTTRWRPDTCDCIIEYSWDDTLSEQNRVHTLSNYVNKCAAHSILSTDQDRWNTVFDENPRKSRSLQSVLDNGPTSFYDIKDGVRQLKSGIKFDFFWTGTAPNRVLNISFTGATLTTNQRNTIQGVLDTKFGVGKVVLV